MESEDPSMKTRWKTTYKLPQRKPDKRKKRETSLHDWTSAERDFVLAQIEFVSKPRKFMINQMCFDNDWLCEVFGDACNYSMFYEALPPEARRKMPNVRNLRSGDVLICNLEEMRDEEFNEEEVVDRYNVSYFVMWLRKDFNFGSEKMKIRPDYINRLMQYERDADDERQIFFDADVEHFNCSQDRIHGFVDGSSGQHLNVIPHFVAREASGWHDDGEHHCYIFSNHDADNVAISSVFGNLPSNYYGCRYISILLDPLLVHSLSEKGKVLESVRELPTEKKLALINAHERKKAKAIKGQFPDDYIAETTWDSECIWKHESASSYFCNNENIVVSRKVMVHHFQLELDQPSVFK